MSVTSVPDEKEQGEEQAETEALLAHKPMLRAFFSRRVAATHETDDYVQEVYLRVLARVPAKKVSSWRAFLLKTASNLIVERARSRNAVRHRRIDVPIEEAALVEDDSNPERSLAAREQLAQLQAALEQLDPVRRQAFVLCRIEGWSHDEAAKQLGVEREAVTRHVERALYHLARTMTEQR